MDRSGSPLPHQGTPAGSGSTLTGFPPGRSAPPGRSWLAAAAEGIPRTGYPVPEDVGRRLVGPCCLTGLDPRGHGERHRMRFRGTRDTNDAHGRAKAPQRCGSGRPIRDANAPTNRSIKATGCASGCASCERSGVVRRTLPSRVFATGSEPPPPIIPPPEPGREERSAPEEKPDRIRRMPPRRAECRPLLLRELPKRETR